VLLALYAIVSGLSGRTVAGWTSTVLIVSSVGAVQLLCLGLLGEYIGRMYTQMQGRPTYFIAYDSLTATRGRHGPTDTPLPPDGKLIPGTHAPVAPVPASAARVRRDQEAHTGELLDR
jgi:dolichol-phosphate mannosyltransferase